MDTLVLDEALASSLGGRGRRLIFEVPESGLMARHLENWWSLAGPERGFYHTCSAREQAWIPYAPLMDLARALLVGVLPVRVREILEDSRVYHRHRLLLAMALGLEPLESLSLVEDPIPDEMPQEWNRIKEGLKFILGSLLCDRVVLLHCQNSDTLAIESLELLDDPGFWEGLPIVAVLQFQARPLGQDREQYLEVRRSRGEVMGSHGLQVPGDSSETFTENPIPGGKGTRQAPAVTVTDYKSLELMVQLLCFRSVLELTTDLEKTTDLAFLRALCHESLEEFEDALLDLQGPEVSQEESPRWRFLRDWLASRINRSLNDWESSRRLAAQATHSVILSGRPQDQARLDYLWFELMMVPEGLEREYFLSRIQKELQDLGWWNHLAYFLGISLENLRVLREQGQDAARYRCQKAIRLARKYGNSRRLGNALHGLAKVEETAGELARADRIFRRLPRVYGKDIVNQEKARLHNGHGYLLFLMGRYRQALVQHSRALDLLNQGRHHEETLMTALNVARVYLFGGWPQDARQKLEDILAIMDSLGMEGLPFHDRGTLDALFGLCCLKSGRLAQAREIETRLRAQVTLLDRPSQFSGLATWFLALSAASRGEVDQAEDFWSLCQHHWEQLPAELGYLRVPVLKDWALSLAAQERPRESRTLLEQALAMVPQSNRPEWIQRSLKDLLEGRNPNQPCQAPRIALDTERLLRAVLEDRRIRDWRRRVRSSEFLRHWQEWLYRGLGREALLDRCARLVRAYFLVDEVAFVLKGALPRIWTQALEQRIDFGHGKDPGTVKEIWDASQEADAQGFRSRSLICLERSTEGELFCTIGSRLGSGAYTREDHSFLVLALGHLDTALLVSHKDQAILWDHYLGVATAEDAGKYFAIGAAEL